MNRMYFNVQMVKSVFRPSGSVTFLQIVLMAAMNRRIAHQLLASRNNSHAYIAGDVSHSSKQIINAKYSN